MLFWLKKALTVPFLPLYFSLLAGGVGFLLQCFPKRRKTSVVLFSAAFLSLAVFSNRGVARLLLRPLEYQYPAIAEASVTTPLPSEVLRCKGIVVLGGGHFFSHNLAASSQLSTSALSRLVEGIRLARLLPNAEIVVSGYNGAQQVSHAQVLASAAISLGVDPQRMVRFDYARDTDDEAQELRKRYGSEPFILVTSAWHMPRAMALCRRAGLNPFPAPADFMEKCASASAWDFFVFDLAALERSTKAIHEHLGLLWARARNRA